MELADFYDSRLGQMARRLILRRITEAWSNMRGLRLLGYGHAMPYLGGFVGKAERVVVAVPQMPERVRDFPSGLVTVAPDDALPFPDAMFDRILVVHGLERTEALRPLLRQLWRVLAPEGRILIIAPNRASLWAQMEHSPFGVGRPFSRGELDAMLRAAMFTPERESRALHMPPLQSLSGSGPGWERLGARFFAGLGGVHVVEAGKSLYAPVGPAAVPVGALPQQIRA